MGIVGTSFRALLQPHYPVCLLKHTMYLTHTNFSPLNTIVVDKRQFVLLTVFILKINKRYMRAFCHRKREEDWSQCSPLTDCCTSSVLDRYFVRLKCNCNLICILMTSFMLYTRCTVYLLGFYCRPLSAHESAAVNAQICLNGHCGCINLLLKKKNDFPT